MTDNIKTNKDQHNDVIENEPNFDGSFNLSRRTKDPLPVVTIRLRGVRKHRATTVDGLTCLWIIGATNRMIKIRHTKYYGHKMQSNKVEYSTAAGLYCTAYDVKGTFYIPEFSSSKIIEHRFHVDNYKGELGIGYNMVIGRDLMVHLGLTPDFNRQVLQGDCATVPMK